MYTQQEELQRDGLKEILVDCFKVTLKGKYLLKGKDKGTVERDFKGTVLGYCWKGSPKGLF